MDASPLLFVNVGWMIDYGGVSKDDPTLGGHGYLKNNALGHESWNFAPLRGNVFGYVPGSARINLKNLGGDSSTDSCSNVTVVWLARSPHNGVTSIVGWYKHAIVYREKEHILLRRKGGYSVGYQIVAPAKDAVLLPTERRLFPIPTKKKKGSLGQSSIWYGGSDKFRATVSEYIGNNGILKRKTGLRVPKRQADPEARKKIELAAIRHATVFYESLEGGGRVVESVEKDGVGWDLTVSADNGEILKVEVKGLSGRDLVVELTPNEYKQMRSAEHRTPDPLITNRGFRMSERYSPVPCRSRKCCPALFKGHQSGKPKVKGDCVQVTSL
jgi:hypothetical protein